MILLRRPLFTLIEALIAMALTVVLLSVVTFFYRELNLLTSKTEEVQKESFKMRYVENRLSQIFPKAVSSNTRYKDFFFFTVSDPGNLFLQGSPVSLIFTYDNDTDKNKLLSNHVLGRLFLDKERRLSLATWPSRIRWPEGGTPPMKLEVLLDEVDALKIEFFVPPDKGWKPKFLGEEKQQADKKEEKEPDSKAKTPTKKQSQQQAPAAEKQETEVKPAPEGTWKEEWSQDYKLLPGLVRLNIKRKGKTLIYVFPLSETKRQIVYTQ